MDILRYELEIKHHAFRQAIRRGISPDAIEATIVNGKIIRYGKHGVKFVKKGKRTLICVGQMIGNTIKIFTIEEET